MSAATPHRPTGRYGPPLPRWQRALRLGAAALVVAGLAGGLLWLAWRASSAPVRSGLVDFQTGPTSSTATIDVLRPVGQPVTCVVRAAGEGMAEVGRVEVTVPTDAPRRRRVEVTVPTVAPARAVTLSGCTASG